jgi:hypothetical protein
MHQRALAGKGKVLEWDYPDIVTSVDNLVSVLQDQGKYDEAELMHR